MKNLAKTLLIYKTLLYTCLRRQTVYVLLVRDKGLMISLGQVTSKEGQGENDCMKLPYSYSRSLALDILRSGPSIARFLSLF